MVTSVSLQPENNPLINMTMNDQKLFDKYGREVSLSGRTGSAIGTQLMRKVYNWMALALIVTGLTAYYVATHFAREMMSGGTMLIFIILELAVVFILSARIQKLSFQTAGLMFLAYSVLNGITLSYIFLLYTAQSISSAFFIAAGTFVAMSLVGYFTKKNLSNLGGYLLMALIGLIIAMVVNMFVRNSMFDLIISCIGVLVFVGLTAYDTQKIKQLALEYGNDVNEQTQKIALMGSLMLYLDFINLFLYLLRLLGRSNN